MKKILMIPAVLFLCSSVAFCEYFYLRSGEEIQGKIISETTSTVKITEAGSNKQRVLQIKDIYEISAKKKAVAPKPAETYGVEYAKTAFTSSNQSNLDGAQEYITDNKSGLLVYSVKETEQYKPKPSSGKTPVAADNAAVAAGEFDAAAYLLSGQSGQSPQKPQEPAKQAEPVKQAELVKQAKPDAKSKQMPPEQKKTSAPKPLVSKPSASKPSASASVSDGDDYDAALYLMGKSQAKSQTLNSQPDNTDDDFDAASYLLGNSQAKPKEEIKTVKRNEDYDASKYRIKESAKPSFNDKPDNETLLALSFDLKGTVKFNGTVKIGMELSDESDYGVSVSAEHYAYLTKLFALGLGVEYNFQRYLNETGRYSFLPIFIAAKMRIISGETYHIYAAARLGGGIFTVNSSYWLSDTRGGFYCAGGIGASYNHFVLQALYSYNGASLSYKAAADEIDADVSFSKLGIYFGYLF